MFRNPIPDTSELISKKDRGTISSQTRFPDMNLNPENTTEMNPFIILLVQNATKCIFHTQES